MFTNKTIPSKAQFLLKAENYCAYQERSTYEVKNKLLQWGVSKQDIEEIISHLIEKNFLNEIRFAQAYAHEKFHINGWGRYKIKYALNQNLFLRNLFCKLFRKLTNQSISKN